MNAEHRSPGIEARERRSFASETKFLLSRELAAQVRLWSRASLLPDPNASGDLRDTYRITSLYFDTPSLDVFLRNGSYGRAKYRIRRYGSGGVAFLERKLRTRKMLTKRRSCVDVEELPKLEGEMERGWSGYWFHRRLLKRDLHPVCQVSYLRMSRLAVGPCGPIRLTLDDEMRAWPVRRSSFCGGTGTPLLEDQLVLELKFIGDMPILFKNLVEEFALNPISFSKYRCAAAELGLPNRVESSISQESVYA